MSRLTIPEPEIELYKDGFKSHATGKLHDQLGREPTGKALSEVVLDFRPVCSLVKVDLGFI